MVDSRLIKYTGKVVAVCYYFTVFFLTLFTTERYGKLFLTGNINFVPFEEKINYIKNFSLLYNNEKWFIIKEITGNLLLFFPFSFFASVLSGKKNNKLFIGVSIILVVLMIEFTQYFLHIGKFDIDDIVLNISGGFIGIFALDKLSNKWICK